MKNSNKLDAWIIESQENMRIVKCVDYEKKRIFFFIALQDKSGKFYVKSGRIGFSSLYLSDCAKEATNTWKTEISAKRNMEKILGK